MGDSIPEQRDSNTGGNRGKTGHGMDLRIALGKASARKRRVCKEQITMESVHGREHIKGSDDKAKIAIKDTASHWRQRASGRRQAPQSERQSEQGGLAFLLSPAAGARKPRSRAGVRFWDHGESKNAEHTYIARGMLPCIQRGEGLPIF